MGILGSGLVHTRLVDNLHSCWEAADSDWDFSLLQMACYTLCSSAQEFNERYCFL